MECPLVDMRHLAGVYIYVSNPSLEYPLLDLRNLQWLTSLLGIVSGRAPPSEHLVLLSNSIGQPNQAAIFCLEPEGSME